jgi:hypothetical protein
MSREYTSRDRIINGISQRNISGLLPTRPTFLRILQKCVSESMIPYLPSSSNECIACSEMPPEEEIYISDGTSVGLLETHIDPDNRLFNSFPDQLPPAICTNPNVFRVDLPKESCLVVTKALPWDQLSCFSGGGNNVDIQESVLGYALCKWKKPKSIKFSPYTNDDITTLHNLLKGKVYDDKINNVLKIDIYRDPEAVCMYLISLQMPLKSHGMDIYIHREITLKMSLGGWSNTSFSPNTDHNQVFYPISSTLCIFTQFCELCNFSKHFCTCCVNARGYLIVRFLCILFNGFNHCVHFLTTTVTTRKYACLRIYRERYQCFPFQLVSNICLCL